MNKEFPIDFVVTWVDSSDPAWITEYSKYRTVKHDEDAARYRDWDLFKYWFRAIEKNAPWFNKVYLVTCGQYPKWLNLDNPKLVLVKHSDYIPQQYLPTFNSRCIELNFGRIKELSEHFVYFNDDMYINAPVSRDYYFKKGLPVDFNIETRSMMTKFHPKQFFGINLSLYCNVAVLNYHFDRRTVVRNAFTKWYGFHLGFKNLLTSVRLFKSKIFHGFLNRHTEQPYLKSTFAEIWEKEPVMLDKTCTRFRIAESLTPYFAREWQLASNNFSPCKHRGKIYNITERSFDEMMNNLQEGRDSSLCLNDTPKCSPEFYNEASVEIQQAMEKRYPQKSSFEL